MFKENIMNGNFWFISASLMLTALSCAFHFYFAYKNYEEESEQERYVTMLVRLVAVLR